ncbi:hypothetical protein PG988_006673 [Apiospora saccharicola]
MAHQAHALPWNTLAKHYKYKVSYVHEPQRKDIFPAEKGSDSKEIDYFCRALAQRVQEFAETERAKYRPQAEFQDRAKGWTKSVVPSSSSSHTPSSGGKTETRMVIPEELEERYFEEGRGKNGLPSRVAAMHCGGLQDLSKWTEGPWGSKTFHADAIKVMMMEAAGTPPAICAAPGHAALKERVMESLLLVANKPEADLLVFLDRQRGHRHPVCAAAEEAIRVYLYLNLLVVMHEKGDSDVCDYVRDESTGEEITGRRNYMDLKSYRRLLNSAAGEYDGDAHNLVHWDYFYTRGEDDWNRDESKDVLADMEGLKEYLKGVWRILVVYDLLAREAGADPALEEMCRTTLDISFS